MTSILVALLGLVGSVVAGNAFSDWLKRRTLHESIKADLSVWSALPDSAAKWNLLQQIQKRVQELPTNPRPSAVLRFAALLGPVSLYIPTLLVISAISNGSAFRRDGEGVLRWYPRPGSEASVTFLDFILWVPFVILVPAILGPLLDGLFLYAKKKWSGSGSRKA